MPVKACAYTANNQGIEQESIVTYRQLPFGQSGKFRGAIRRLSNPWFRYDDEPLLDRISSAPWYSKQGTSYTSSLGR